MDVEPVIYKIWNLSSSCLPLEVLRGSVLPWQCEIRQSIGHDTFCTPNCSKLRHIMVADCWKSFDFVVVLKKKKQWKKWWVQELGNRSSWWPVDELESCRHYPSIRPHDLEICDSRLSYLKRTSNSNLCINSDKTGVSITASESGRSIVPSTALHKWL